MKKLIFILSLFICVSAFSQNTKISTSKIFYADSYGTIHNGSSDDQPGIQRAVNACEAAGGGIVHLGAGNYGVNSTILVNVSNVIIEGEGPGATIITGLSDYGNIISFTPVTNPATVAYAFHDVVAQNFSIQSAVTRTSGYAIYSTYTHNARVENVVIGFFRTATVPNNVITPFFNGIAFANESNFVMSNTQIYSWHEGVYVSGKQVGAAYRNTNNFDGLITGNCLILGDTTKWHAADTTCGLKIDGGIGGIQLEQSNISFYTNNVHIDANFGANTEIYLNHAFASDNAGTDGVYAGPNSFHILQMTGGWSCGSGRSTASSIGHGVHVATPNSIASTIITGGTYYANSGYSFYIEDGRLIINGPEFNGGTPSTQGDVYLGTNVTAANIIGTDAATITNSSSITPVISANSGYNTDQSSFGTNNLYRYSTSTAGTSNFALLNNSVNYISDNMFGSAHVGNVFTGIPSAGISARVTYGAGSVIGTSTVGGSGAPIYIGSNMNLTTGTYQIKLDAGTTDFYNPIGITQSSNGLLTNYIVNPNTGTGTSAGWHITANDKDSYIYQTPSNYTTAALQSALILQPQTSTGKIILYSNAGQAVTMLPTKEMLFGGATTNNNAWTQMAAGTTTEAQAYYASSTAPTTPTNGMLWYDGTHFYFHSTTDHDLLAAGGGTPAGATTNVQYNNAGAFGGDAGFTYTTSSGALSLLKNQNAGTVFQASNNNTAAGGYVGLQATGSTYSSYLLQYSSGTTPAGAFVANAGGLYYTGPNLVLMADNASGEIDLAPGSGSTKKYIATTTEFKPGVTTTYDLGTASLQWRTLYAQNATLTGAFTLPTSSHATSFTPSATDVVVYCTAAITVTLPTASSNTGRILYVKNLSAGNVTLSGMGTGEFTLMSVQGTTGASVTLQSNGTSWFGISMGQ